MYNTDLPTRAELPSSRQLLRSTAIAFVVAGALLTTTVLPAEYGIDPTGIGGALGLTQMGQIKTSRSAEAAADAKAAAAPAVATPAAPAPAPAPPATPAPALAAVQVAQAPSGKRDEMTITLRPGQGAEIKLDMRKGDQVEFSWQSSGGAVNFDTHGDPVNAPKNFYHGYGKGREGSVKGTLQAAFDGQHGWFWRNRGQADVNVTLKTQGQYSAIKRVL